MVGSFFLDVARVCAQGHSAMVYPRFAQDREREFPGKLESIIWWCTLGFNNFVHGLPIIPKAREVCEKGKEGMPLNRRNADE